MPTLIYSTPTVAQIELEKDGHRYLMRRYDNPASGKVDIYKHNGYCWILLVTDCDSTNALILGFSAADFNLVAWGRSTPELKEPEMLIPACEVRVGDQVKGLGTVTNTRACGSGSVLYVDEGTLSQTYPDAETVIVRRPTPVLEQKPSPDALLTLIEEWEFGHFSDDAIGATCDALRALVKAAAEQGYLDLTEIADIVRAQLKELNL